MIRLIFIFSLILVGTFIPYDYGDNTLKLGIDVLEETKFSCFNKEDKIGILTHDPATNLSSEPTYKLFLKSPLKKNIVCLFCPENGLSAVPPVGKLCSRDTIEGIPVYSLCYNEEKPKWAPTKYQLEKIDVLVIDLCDTGVRCYAYITCMRFALEQCVRYGKRVIILDRPNPLGRKISGPFINKELQGYVGGFLIPHVHGMTIGELARMILMDYQEHPWLTPLTKEELKKANEDGFLTIIKMKNYKPDCLWPEQNWPSAHPWIPTSSNIPCFESALGYSCMIAVSIYGNLTSITSAKRPDPNNLKIQPFRFIRVEPKELAQKVCDELNQKKLPGIQFETIPYKRDEKGIYLNILDWKSFNPGLCMLSIVAVDAKLGNPKKYDCLADNYCEKRKIFSCCKDYLDVTRAVIGDYEWIQDLVHNSKKRFNEERVSYFLQKWENECKIFEEKRKAWLLYP